MTDSEDVIRLYLDDDTEAFKTARPPIRFQFSTLHLADGPHRLRIEAHNGLAGDSVREIPFHVRNGVAITVSGLESGQEIAGQVGVIINAYAGNTEVDFEPSRAETPQPIPTWAWLIFLAIVAFTMFYVLNPGTRRASVATAETTQGLGERVYVDNCAKCHQEDGEGLGDTWPPPRLKDADMVLEADPTTLVTFVVAGPPPAPSAGSGGSESVGSGRPRLRMPAWGTRISSDDIVAALNYVRTHWGNQAPEIVPNAKRPEADIRARDRELVEALQRRDLEKIEQIYSLDPTRPVRLVRPDDAVDVPGNEDVLKAIKSWLDTIGSVNSLTAVDASYATIEVSERKKVVYAHGTQVLTVSPKGGGQAVTTSGPFVRVYVQEGYTTGEGGGGFIDADQLDGEARKHIRWMIAFDWARLPMPIGCDEPGREKGFCPPSMAARTFYADIVKMLAGLDQAAPNAPHGNFWTLPYKDFVALEFPYPKIPGAKIKLINVGPGVPPGETNFVKALQDGREVHVTVPGKAEPVVVDIERMPKDKPGLSPNDIARIAAWIERGMPESSAGGAPPTPPGPPPPPPPPPPPAMDPAMDPPGMDGPAPGDVDFQGVVEILKKLNPKWKGSPHRNFWEKPYADFVATKFDWPAAGGSVTLIEKGNSARSNLIRALMGQPLLVTDDKGAVTEVALDKPMPPSGKGSTASDADIEKIAKWIDRGAPEK